MQQAPVSAPGGRVRIASTPQFPNLDRDRSGPGRGGSGALMREIHGHPNADESQYYVSGQGRIDDVRRGGERAHLRLPSW
jgi:oxalate decarboxylase